MHCANELNTSGYTDDLKDAITSKRKENQFPPDYQAQILQEACGSDYFRAMESLNVDQFNDAHLGIAWLAKHNFLKAIVTTNFDCLIEKALEHLGVVYEVAFDSSSFAKCLQYLTEKEDKLFVIKAHGSATDHLSIIDTLKQRLIGLGCEINQCMETLLRNNYWVYAGFSADDLSTSPGYLRINPNAERCPGLTFIQWPGPKGAQDTNAPSLSDGAKKMVRAYDNKASVVTLEVVDFVNTLCTSLNIEKAPVVDASIPSVTDEFVLTFLNDWANTFVAPVAVNCLVAMADACGLTGSGFTLMDKFWADSSMAERKDESYRRFRYQHGRIGVGVGILSLVQDEEGKASKQALECLQNLYVREKTEHRVAAWAGVAHVWCGVVPEGIHLLDQARRAFNKSSAPTIEDIDTWLAISEAYYILGKSQWSLDTYLELARAASNLGDLPRKAKVLSLMALVFAEFVPKEFESFYDLSKSTTFDYSSRLKDPQMMGFQQLAFGRFYSKAQKPVCALAHLKNALELLEETERKPWIILARIEYTKALIDNDNLYASQDLIIALDKEIDDYQVWLPWFEELKGQFFDVKGHDKESKAAYYEGIDFAKRLSLDYKAELIKKAMVAIEQRG